VGCRLVLSVCLSILCIAVAWAGPPFVTDDPEPVDLHHWEVYAASARVHDSSGTSGTLPHAEVNYGAAPNLQLHAILPSAFSHPTEGGTTRGLGDIELGVKSRFVQETDGRPMVGAFPLLEVPTGSSRRGLGSGHLQVFLPVWLQKSRGTWTSYGGGGYHTNPGVGNRGYWLLGWEVQKDLSTHLTLGAEVFHTSPMRTGGRGSLVTNVGGQYNLDEGHHILFSLGRNLKGDTQSMTYLAFQWTFGPPEK
jgi:hypothetical protein